MAKKRGPKGYSDEKIVSILRAVERAQGEGSSIKDAIREHDISEQTFYRWKRSFGSMRPEEVKQLRALKKGNALLKKIVAELTIDKSILKEAVEGKY